MASGRRISTRWSPFDEEERVERRDVARCLMDLEGKSDQLRDFSMGANDIEEALIVSYEARRVYFFISRTELVDGSY